MLGDSVLDHGVGHNLDYVPAVQPAPGTDRQALPSELIDQVQHPHRPAIVRIGADEIVRPDVIGSLRPQPYARTVIEPQPTSWLLFLGNLQPFAAPDALYPILAHSPARFPQRHRDASVALAAILAGQHDNGPGQCIFIITLCRLVALRALWLIHQLARSPLTDAMLFPRMAHRTTPRFGLLEVSRGDVLQHQLVQA
jgi:hypothetical protein